MGCRSPGGGAELVGQSLQRADRMLVRPGPHMAGAVGRRQRARFVG